MLHLGKAFIPTLFGGIRPNLGKVILEGLYTAKYLHNGRYNLGPLHTIWVTGDR